MSGRILPLVAGLILAGCGYFERTGSEAAVVATTAPVPTSAVPAPVEPPSPTSTSASEPVTTTSSGLPPAASARPNPVNAASATSDGIEVTVVAEPTMDARGGFRIEVQLRNVSDHDRYIVLTQSDYAAIEDVAGATRWSYAACNPTTETYEISRGTSPIPPGASTSVVIRYPQPDIDRDMDCGIPPGDYVLYGQFPVCPDDAVYETANPGTYACERGAAVLYRSAGLPFQMG